ncbi:hypothetical protein RF11_12827 [Thelohanellus kitauei]|uniref:Uncharacterized protein n=1 Tax=Thelohanellus kitauei TaxID=669202 RepID=A0A0C2IX07_THEKT|nr:hypothetical protein RF11_12827 [Thelohanellus kitauei]
MLLGPMRCLLGCKRPRRSKRVHECPEEMTAMKNCREATCQGGLEGALKRSLFLTRTLCSASRPLLTLCEVSPEAPATGGLASPRVRKTELGYFATHAVAWS